MFLDLPDPLVRGMDPDPDPDPALDPDLDLLSSCKNSKIPTIFFTLFYFLSLKNDAIVASKSHEQKKLC